MRFRTALAAVVAVSLLGVASMSAGAGAQSGQGMPGPTDAQAAAEAGRQSRQQPSGSTQFSALVPPSVGPQQFTSARVFATQYNPNTPGSFEVAVPDKCAKFAALGWASTLAQQGCPPGYAIGLDYRVIVTRDSGQSAVIPVKDAGPWNIDDNYWDYGGSPRPRRFAADLPPGLPEAEAAFSDGYRPSANCSDLQEPPQPTGHGGNTDQFGRCVLNPAGIDLSAAAASTLGFSGSGWVTVTFLWEPLRNNIASVNSGKVVDVAGASSDVGGRVIQWSPNGGPNQQWRFLALSSNTFVVQSVNSGQVLDVAGGSTAVGAQVIQWPWNGGPNQWWRFEPTGDGAFALVSVNSGQVVDVAGGSFDEGGIVIQWPWNGGPNQQWRLAPIGNG